MEVLVVGVAVGLSKVRVVINFTVTNRDRIGMHVLELRRR